MQAWFQPHKHYFSIALLVISAVGFSVVVYSKHALIEVDQAQPVPPIEHTQELREKPKAITVKGIYLTASTAVSEKRRAALIDLINSTELNSVIIDIKDYTGNVLYESAVPSVAKYHTQRSVLGQLSPVIQKFKDAGVYVIARQTVFQDPVLAKAKPEWAIKTENGSLWQDYKGLSWVDPTRREVWKYNIDIAIEAINSGFDEVNFDYIRFPSDGPIKQARYSDQKTSKADTMKAFLTYLHERLKDKPGYVSADLFGMVTVLHDSDMNIGQKLVSAIGNADYICPMMYPSHYPKGYLGYTNPADHPYEVVHDGLLKSEKLLVGTGTKLRPWLQAFNLGAQYDAEKIRAQIRAVEESSITDGWMLWNASNRYTTAGLKT